MTKRNLKIFFNQKEETYFINKKEKGSTLLFEGTLTKEQILVLESNISLKENGIYK